ncbi:MAG: hypothetical protein H6719_15135 [Sandaracinaceae bacterium]|nr:hypothetical protein [Sandaracinaceae bacterium]
MTALTIPAKRACALLLALGLVACDGGGDPDAAVADGSTDAASALDAGVDADAARPDAGPPPDGLLGIDDLTYVGAFRIASDMYGASTPDYATGALGYCPERRSLYLAGFDPDAMIGEFAIPDPLGTGTDVAGLPAVDSALQGFAPVLSRATGGNPEGLDKVTGMLWVDGDLIVNANVWYDADGATRDTTLIVRGGQLDGTVDGYLRLEGGALAAGYMAPIPEVWRDALGGTTLVGWASNYSIVSRYSVGPSLYAFDAEAVVGAPLGGTTIATTAWMSFPYSEGVYLADDALEYQCDVLADMVTTECAPGAVASDLWNFVSKAMYGFIVPGTRTFALFGSLGGSRTGLGYKITQDDGNLCGGPCARGADDYDNYYWFFDLDDILTAATPSAPRPYAYGPWSVPFDDGGRHAIIGGAYAPDTGLLYLSLSGAGQVGDYDRPPVIVAYDVIP